MPTSNLTSPVQQPTQSSDAHSTPPEGGSAPQSSIATKVSRQQRPSATRRWLKWIAGGVVLAIALFAGVPWILETLHTVSTDDAYVNGHVTFVAPRVAGQVSRVLVDDNNRVHKGDLLVQLDPEPFQVQVNIAKSAVESAQADSVAALAEARGIAGRSRSLRFAMEHAMEDVRNQIALIHSKVAVLKSREATLDHAKYDYERIQRLAHTDSAPEKELKDALEALRVSQADIETALNDIYQVRVNLGLPPKPVQGDDLTQVPGDLDQTHSSVRQAQASLIQSIVQLGVNDSFDKPPLKMIADFYKRDPDGNIDRIYENLIQHAPGVIQSQSRLAQAKRNLDQAELNRRYCNVIAEIDGVVTRRNVNPGNNVVVGQGLMAVRSLTEIWVDANFKETQLSELRIGQRADLDVDMYGKHRRFEGRISGFTMGTGSTLALLPPENATGNFVKVVQRLPVRIELVNYNPDKIPLFVGLSVTPRVRLDQSPSGPDAGKILQPHMPQVAAASASTSSSAVEAQP